MRVVLPLHRGAFGQDGDAAFFFQVVGVHHPVGHLLVVAESAGLAKHGVDQRGLAVVDMGDDGDVTKIHDFKPFEAVCGRLAWRGQPPAGRRCDR